VEVEVKEEEVDDLVAEDPISLPVHVKMEKYMKSLI
jgi:hypothetical protein